MATFRILGLDSGADIILCIPPAAYAAHSGLGFKVPGEEWAEYGVYGDLIMIYREPYSIYLRGTIGFRAFSEGRFRL